MAPTTDGRPPEYHMTQLKAYAMTNDRDTFVQGATAFRNARDLAKHHRDSLILAANSGASRDAVIVAQVNLAVTSQLDNDEASSDEFVNCADYSPPRTPDEPAPGITDVHDCSQASALSDLGDTATSFASSFTSDFTADRSKRRRQPQVLIRNSQPKSPPSKSRHPRGTSMLSQMSPVLSLSQMGEAESVWVKAYCKAGGSTGIESQASLHAYDDGSVEYWKQSYNYTQEG
ncbi:hypothetical protein B0T11DRAFT_273839 [Plectosphaerella cucumerina]|uniref:Uncharacterized protein n=1 Tax=Plectosphaerella cucumerina TaxID=40658 RepID=A0A8K0TUQ5_9PEZI|nr:hypothetical protein B0T11DRAFT_273839 [Plectosphaerella cucumerina]